MPDRYERFVPPPIYSAPRIRRTTGLDFTAGFVSGVVFGIVLAMVAVAFVVA